MEQRDKPTIDYPHNDLDLVKALGDAGLMVGPGFWINEAIDHLWWALEKEEFTSLDVTAEIRERVVAAIKIAYADIGEDA